MLNKFAYIALLFISLNSIAQIGINNANPDSSAVIDMKATDKGFLIPRMSDFERRSVSEPANALLLYDYEDAMFFFYDSAYNTGSINWTGISPWRFRDDLSDFSPSLGGYLRTLYTHPSVRTVSIGTAQPNADNAFNSVGAMVIGDSTSTAPENGLLVVGDAELGSLTATDTVRATNLSGKGTIPVGGIIIWTGTIATIPDGWELCDGGSSNGVTIPDLRGRFIAGYNASASTTPTNSTDQEQNYGQIGNTGGANTHALSISEMPSHDHDGVTGEDGDHDHDFTDNYRSRSNVYRFNDYNEGTTAYESISGTTSNAGSHNHGINSQGGGNSHENRPEYYVVAYIIRVK